MTRRRTKTNYRHALISSVTGMANGLEDSALHISARVNRERNLHGESLRRKIDGGDVLDIGTVVDLTHYMRQRVDGREAAVDWLLCLCSTFDLAVDDVPPPPDGGHPDEAKALQEKFMQLSAKIGKIAGVTAETTADNKIDQEEADAYIPLLRAARVLLHRMERNVVRAVEKGQQ